jgi:hypothetical protein
LVSPNFCRVINVSRPPMAIERKGAARAPRVAWGWELHLPIVGASAACRVWAALETRTGSSWGVVTRERGRASDDLTHMDNEQANFQR